MKIEYRIQVAGMLVVFDDENLAKKFVKIALLLPSKDGINWDDFDKGGKFLQPGRELTVIKCVKVEDESEVTRLEELLGWLG